MAKKRCPKCKYLNPPEVDICSLCSEVLPIRPGDSDMHEEPRELQGGKSKARHKKVADERRHYLVPSSGPPVLLDTGIRFVMGRDPRASLPVQSTDASRRHAEIVWNGDPPQPSLRDIASRHGTYFNGRRLNRDEEVELRHGDLIQLAGSVTLSYRFATPPNLEKELLNEMRSDQTLSPVLPADIVGPSGARAPAAAPAPVYAPPPAPITPVLLPAAGATPSSLSGRFDCLPARSLLLLLELLGANGRLVIRCGDASGSLEMRGGLPIQVQYAGITGPTAIVALSALRSGQFEFQSAEGV